MAKIIDTLVSMGMEVIIYKGPLMKSNCVMRCIHCHGEVPVSVNAAYQQHKRGRKRFICKKCAGIAGWTCEGKEKARTKSKRQWKSADYAGAITGKAMARHIIKKSNLSELFDIDPT